MKVKTLFFGIAKDIFNKNSMVLELKENATMHHLMEELKNNYPEFSSNHEFSLALNEEYVKMNAVLHNNDVVAIIPPVSGG